MFTFRIPVHVPRPHASAACTLAVVAASLGAGCAGGDPAVGPTPLVYTFSFGSDPQALRPYSVWLEDAREGLTNQIAVAVMADFAQDCLVRRLQGTLTYDGTVLQAESHTEGPFMRQGGAEAQTTVTYRRGQITFRIDRSGSVEGAGGLGNVLTIRFRAASNWARGSSTPLQWSEARAFGSHFLECLHATRGGEISVR